MGGTRMKETNNLQIELKDSLDNLAYDIEFDFDAIIYDFENELNLLSSQADHLDYLVSAASGLLAGLLDILWVGEFDLKRGREIASDKIDGLVLKTAKMLGWEGEDLQSAVQFLEKNYNLASDGNTAQFGGGLQHHLRDFAHHPTIVGMIFSLLTQFTHKSYGTDTKGHFIIIDLPERSKEYIGKNTPEKIFFGTVTWFFHLISDVAGSSSTVGKSGGTGLPGPILSLAKQMSVLPFFKNMNIGDHSFSVFLSKLFNGTLFLKRDETGKIIKESIIKFDLRGELGAGIELGKQAIPVIANESIVRIFYFIRHLALEMEQKNIQRIEDFQQIDWQKVKPYGNPTISRMLTISTGVFTTVDLSEAIITKKLWLSINYPGVGRFALAIGEDVNYGLKSRNVKKVKKMYEEIQRKVFGKVDSDRYERMASDMKMDKMSLTLEQTEILYNLEYHKTLNDIKTTKAPFRKKSIISLKEKWLDEWKDYMAKGFPSFIQVEDAELSWYSEKQLLTKIEENNAYDTWFRLVLLESMIFEPYYPLSLEKNRKGNQVASKKYKKIQGFVQGYSKKEGDLYLDTLFKSDYYPKGYIERLRRTYNKVLRELNQVLRGIIKTLSISAAITLLTVTTAGIFSGPIAVALVGSNFAGLSGAALTSASLAYLGGGAIAVGGAGMTGGTVAIVGGGAILGAGVGAGVGGIVGSRALLGKQNTILQSAKLLVAVREIFLNDEHDLTYSNSVYEKYLENILTIEKELVLLRLKADEADKEEKKEIEKNIKEAEDYVEAMKIAKNDMRRFISSFEEGLNSTEFDEK